MGDIRVLVADDEREIRELLRKYLERELYRVDLAADGAQALRLFGQADYDLVVLDVMMPGTDGIEACRQIRNKSNVPILMLSAKDHEVDKVLGLSIGADDYMTKPFGIHEVVAKCKALLRRYLVLAREGTASGQERLTFKGLSIDLRTYEVTVRGEAVSLTAKEFELLKLFATHPNQVFTKTQLFRQAWSGDYIEDDNTVMVHIRKLRKKIELDPSEPLWIQTVWGIGYRFAGEPDAS